MLKPSWLRWNIISVKKKQLVRQNFRDNVFKRDGYRCKKCLEAGSPLDAHHITDRNEMPNGGYVKENGISLCPDCHLKAEEYHQSEGQTWAPDMHPNDLYELIGSSYEEAVAASERLK